MFDVIYLQLCYMLVHQQINLYFKSIKMFAPLNFWFPSYSGSQHELKLFVYVCRNKCFNKTKTSYKQKCDNIFLCFRKDEGIDNLAVKPLTQFPVSLDDEVIDLSFYFILFWLTTNFKQWLNWEGRRVRAFPKPF